MKKAIDWNEPGYVRITEEEMREYGLDKHPDVDFMSADTHPEEMKQIMNCLADKFLARSAILKAELQAKGEWKEEHETPGDYEVGDEEMSSHRVERPIRIGLGNLPQATKR